MKGHDNSRKSGVFFRILLLAVEFLLTMNIMAYLVQSSPTYAAKSKEYKVASYFSGKSKPEIEVQMQAVLKQAGADGWELVTLDSRNHLLIFKK
jgi:hypothetical protein